MKRRKTVFSIIVLCLLTVMLVNVGYTEPEPEDWIYEIPKVPNIEDQFKSIAKYDSAVIPFATAYGKENGEYIGDLTSSMELTDSIISQAIEAYYDDWVLGYFSSDLISAMEGAGLDDELKEAFEKATYDALLANIPGFPPAYWKASHYQGMVRGNNPDGTPMLIVARNGNQKDFAKQAGTLTVSFKLPDSAQDVCDKACDSSWVCAGLKTAVDACGVLNLCGLSSCIIYPSCARTWFPFCSYKCCYDKCVGDWCWVEKQALKVCEEGVDLVCDEVCELTQTEFSIDIPKCDLLDYTDFKCQDNKPGDLHVFDMSSRLNDGNSIGDAYYNPTDLSTWNEKLDKVDNQWMHPGGGQLIGFKYSPEDGEDYKAQLAFFGTNGYCDIENGVCTGENQTMHSAIVIEAVLPETGLTKSYDLRSITHYYDQDTEICPVDGTRHIMPFMQNLAVTIQDETVLFAYAYGGTLDFFYMSVEDLYTLLTTDDPDACTPLVRMHTGDPPYPIDIQDIAGWEQSELRDRDGYPCECAPDALGCTESPTDCSPEDFPFRPQNMSFVQDTDGLLYLITMFNDPDAEAYIKDVVSPLGLFQVELEDLTVSPGDTVEKWNTDVMIIAIREVDLGDWAKGTADYMGDYLAAGTAYVGPGGRLFVYSAEHYPWGPQVPGHTRRSLRFGELASISPILDPIADQVADEGSETTFDLGQFTVGGNPEDVQWQAVVDWGDGSTKSVFMVRPDTPLSASHTYPDGLTTYDVQITVVESMYEFTGDATFQVEVQNVSPTVDAGPDQTIFQGDVVTLDPPATFSDPGFDCPACDPASTEEFTATVDWGDGVPDSNTTVTRVPGAVGVLTTGTATAAHQYLGEPGVQQVQVCVDDQDGGVGCDTLEVTVLHGFLRFCAYADDEHHGLTVNNDSAAMCVEAPWGVPDEMRPSGVGSRGDIDVNDQVTVEGIMISLDGKIYAGPDASVSGVVSAGDDVIVGSRSHFDDSITSGHRVDVNKYASVEGDITAADWVIVDPTAVVTGTVTEFADVPAAAIISWVDFSASPGTENVTLRKGESLLLDEGLYQDLKVGSGATLTLVSGKYAFRNFMMEKGALLKIDLSDDPGTIVVDVAERLLMKRNVQISISPDANSGLPSGEAEDILFRIGRGMLDDADVQLQSGGKYLGTFLAPYSSIQLGDEAELVGALYGRKVNVEKGALITGKAARDLFAETFVKYWEKGENN